MKLTGLMDFIRSAVITRDKKQLQKLIGMATSVKQLGKLVMYTASDPIIDLYKVIRMINKDKVTLDDFKKATDQLITTLQKPAVPTNDSFIKKNK